MGALKIEEDRIRGIIENSLLNNIKILQRKVVGRSEFEKPVQFSQLSSADVRTFLT